MVAFPKKEYSLIEICQSFKPTMLFVVPRALTAIYNTLKKVIEDLLPSERDEINRILKIKKGILLENNIVTGFEKELERFILM